MFDTLSDKLNSVFKQLKGQGKLSEKNIADGLREVRMALLEADVHYQVVKKLVADVKERALGKEVMGSLTPGQQVVKIVNESLTQLMGETHQGLNLAGEKPVAVMLVGLQGSGKTTTAGKLSVMLRKTGKQPYLVPADVYRPAAIDQLKTLGGQLGVPVYDSTPDMDPVVTPWAWASPAPRRVQIAKQMNLLVIMTSLFLPSDVRDYTIENRSRGRVSEIFF